MDTSQSDIVIELQFQTSGSVNPKALLQGFDTLEEALYESDRRDIERLSSELKIAPVVRDASLERLRQYRHRRLLLMDARAGSLTIIGLVAGISFWVLESTLGEAVTDGFKDTTVYRQLRDTVRKTVDEKALFITESTRRAFRSKDRDARVMLLPSAAGQAQHIVVELPARSSVKDSVPSIGQAIDRAPS